MPQDGDSYLAAGVDVPALEGLKERIKAFSASTQQSVSFQTTGVQASPLQTSKGFAGLYPLTGFREPVLVASTDGVGTKLKIASALGKWESLGADLVVLNVNDVLTWGARPLFFLDYLAVGELDVESLEALVKGMASACRDVSCALIGGETAQMPGVYSAGDMDMAGFLVGAVERDEVLDSATVAPGDAILGVPSSGLHTNGFSLVRSVFGLDHDPAALQRRYDELGRTLGEELLTPHRSYYPQLQPAFQLVKSMAHITGGGLPGKLPLALPEGMAARLHEGAWERPPIFDLIQHTGNVDTAEMYRVFNMGVGMALVCTPDNVAAVMEAVPDARIVGEVIPQRDNQRLYLEE